MKEQGVLGQKAVSYLSPEPSIQMEKVGIPEPQGEVGPEQIDRPHESTGPVGKRKYTGAGPTGLAVKSISISGSGGGKIRLQLGQRGAHAIETKAA